MKESKVVLLMTVGEDLQAEIIEEALMKEGIPLLKKHREGGAYLSIYMGKSMYGIDLFVSEENYSRAAEILHQLGITDIEGENAKTSVHKRALNTKRDNNAQTRIFKIGIFLIFLLWLFLWWRSA